MLFDHSPPPKRQDKAETPQPQPDPAAAPLQQIANRGRPTPPPQAEWTASQSCPDTYLRGWAGQGDPPLPLGSPRPQKRRPEQPTLPAFSTSWTKHSGLGDVHFADSGAVITTAIFTLPGTYVLRLAATSASDLRVAAENAPLTKQFEAVHTRNFKFHTKVWNARAKALIVEWIASECFSTSAPPLRLDSCRSVIPPPTPMIF